MNAQITKEVRLLLPAYLAALALAVVPVWLLPRNPWAPTAVIVYAFGLAVTVLALSSFGREFSMATFPLLLAQPVARPRIWWTKVVVLAVAMGTVLVAACFSCMAWSFTGPGPSVWQETLMIGIPTSLVAFAGGLWSTLLLRQVTAAFWFTVFVPAGIAAVILALGGTVPWILGVLSLYSVAGFVLAWKLFRGAQEAMWTGGTVALPGWGSAQAGSLASGRSSRPIAALLTKELQLQQVSLLGMAALLILHLGVVLTRKATQGSLEGTARAVLDFYPFVWVFVPLLVGSLSIAEERRLGTMEAHLGLPVSSRIQFMIKFAFVIVLGGLLSSVLLVVAEGLGMALGAPAQIGIFEPGKTPVVLFCTLLAVSFVSFYASSLTRNLLQAMAVSVALSLVTFTLYKTGPAMDEVWDLPLWRGPIFHCIAWPILIIVVLWLGYGNFRRLSGDLSLWRRNIVRLSLALAGIALLTLTVYQRGWELFMALEPAHGPARLNAERPPTLRASHYGGSAFVTLLPDGMLRVDTLQFDPDHTLPAATQLPDRWVWVRGANRLVAGSNWIDAASLPSRVIGIRSDGSLWVSENFMSSGSPSQRSQPLQDAPKMSRFGGDANWSRIVKANPYWVLLLKQDGTLWRWGTNSYSANKVDLLDYEPIRLGNDAEWATMMGSDRVIYGWKKDGLAWVLHSDLRESSTGQIELEKGLFLERAARFDNTRWRSLSSVMAYEAGVREDGTLWTWRAAEVWKNFKEENFLMAPVQFGTGTNWAQIAGRWDAAAALKTDGSLWQWRTLRNGSNSVFDRAPTRLSKRNDWVAVSSLAIGFVSLAADGGLWCWEENWQYPEPLLAISRRPIELENIFGKAR